ncbi:MAG: hypothetical protein ACR2LR_05695 [Hassallia sp.]
MQPSHLPFAWLKTIEGFIARKQLIVKPDVAGREFLTLVSDRLNTQITASAITYFNHVTVSLCPRVSLYRSILVWSSRWCYFVRITAKSPDTLCLENQRNATKRQNFPIFFS